MQWASNPDILNYDIALWISYSSHKCLFVIHTFNNSTLFLNNFGFALKHVCTAWKVTSRFCDPNDSTFVYIQLTKYKVQLFGLSWRNVLLSTTQTSFFIILSEFPWNEFHHSTIWTIQQNNIKAINYVKVYIMVHLIDKLDNLRSFCHVLHLVSQ